MLNVRPNRLRPSRAVLDEDVSVNLGEELHRFELSELQPRQHWDNDTDIRLTNLEAVSSYSWVNESGIPMIAVPGMPPVWSEPSVGMVLPWDKSTTVTEQQSADVVPKYPLLALVASIRQERPDYAFADIDVVTARNSLRRLLRWIRSRGKAALLREFRIDVDVAGDKTILLTRRELRANEPHIKNAHGRGLAFERAATRDESDGAAYMPYMGHHRIVKYRLEGVTMLLPSSTALRASETTESIGSPTSTLFSFYEHSSAATSVNSVDISHLMGDDFDVPPKPSQKSKTREPEVPVIRVLAQGRPIAQRDLVELTTCFDGRFPRWDELCDQLFLSGVPRVHVGFYDRAGAISSVRKYTPGYYRMAQARAKQAESYRQLAELLRLIRQRVMEHPGMNLSLACVSGRLGLYERLDGTVALPAKYLAMFD
ncbi:hypothetical protein AURDEDRAFT_160137 [Auricularia subglabra TFB-10046 SS5]|nr:hypothetical protein AURDEDRAFT_160137 [Auricularia subglabra TFB-10046 SS5]